MKKSEINISYIVPAYNCQDTLEDSISSIFDDNFTTGDEVIVVDDFSTDNTKKLIKRLCIVHPEIIVKFHSKNKGGGATRNTAVQASKHNYIFCLDSDNILKKNSVKALRDRIKNSSSEVISFGELHYFKLDTDHVSHSWKFKLSHYNKQNYLTTNVVPGASGNYLFTKSSWIKAGGYPEFAGALDTWGFGLRQVMTGSTMTIVPKTFYFHRVGIESYWVRESRKHPISSLAAKLLLPYANLLSFRDYYRIYWKRKSEWFLQLDKLPILLQEDKPWRTGIIKIIDRTIFNKI